MLPRYTSDYRTLFWALVLFPLVPALGYLAAAGHVTALDQLAAERVSAIDQLSGLDQLFELASALLWLVPFALYTSYCAGVLTHNHVHVPVFRSQRANALYSAWLSIFYGCPIGVWIPTHLEHHHRFIDGPDDVTRTSRRSIEHDLWQALVYTAACASWQRPLIASYVRRARARRGRHWAALRDQTLALALGHAGMLALAIALLGPWRGALCYALAFGLPAAVSPSLMLFTNYVQHVHCDSASAHDHSRNFVSRLANWFVFDAGYHTVHHERPSVHWSQYAELHRARAASIHPSLNAHSVLSFCFLNYALGSVFPRLRTRPLRSLAPSTSAPSTSAPSTPAPSAPALTAAAPAGIQPGASPRETSSPPGASPPGTSPLETSPLETSPLETSRSDRSPPEMLQPGVV